MPYWIWISLLFIRFWPFLFCFCISECQLSAWSLCICWSDDLRFAFLLNWFWKFAGLRHFVFFNLVFLQSAFSDLRQLLENCVCLLLKCLAFEIWRSSAAGTFLIVWALSCSAQMLWAFDDLPSLFLCFSPVCFWDSIISFAITFCLLPDAQFMEGSSPFDSCSSTAFCWHVLNRFFFLSSSQGKDLWFSHYSHSLRLELSLQKFSLFIGAFFFVPLL